MNYGISVLFRAIPVFMALFCFSFGSFVYEDSLFPGRLVAGPVLIALGGICVALFATAATIIRQIINSYNVVAKYALLAPVCEHNWSEEYRVNSTHHWNYCTKDCIINNYPEQALNSCMNFLSTHDTVRAINILSGSQICNCPRSVQAQSSLSSEEYDKGVELIKIAFAILFTLNGIPSIYYGDEVGLCGWADPFNRMCFPWKKENSDLLEYVKKLSEIRLTNQDIFAIGKLKFVRAHDNVICFKRFSNDEQIVCLVNLSNESISVKEYCSKVILSSKETKDGYLPMNSVMIGMI